MFVRLSKTKVVWMYRHFFPTVVLRERLVWLSGCILASWNSPKTSQSLKERICYYTCTCIEEGDKVKNMFDLKVYPFIVPQSTDTQVLAPDTYDMCNVYTGCHGTSEIECGLCACTVDNPLA